MLWSLSGHEARFEFQHRRIGVVGSLKTLHQGIAIRRYLCHLHRGNGAGRTGFVLNDDRRAQRLHHFFRDHPRDRVSAAGWGYGDNQSDDFAGERGLGLAEARLQQGGHYGDKKLLDAVT